MTITWQTVRPYAVCALYVLTFFLANTHATLAASGGCGSTSGGSGDLSTMTGLFEYVGGIMSNQVFKVLAIIAGALLGAVAFFDGGQLPQLVRLGAGVLGGFCFLLFIIGWIASSSSSVGCVSG